MNKEKTTIVFSLTAMLCAALFFSCTDVQRDNPSDSGGINYQEQTEPPIFEEPFSSSVAVVLPSSSSYSPPVVTPSSSSVALVLPSSSSKPPSSSSTALVLSSSSYNAPIVTPSSSSTMPSSSAAASSNSATTGACKDSQGRQYYCEYEEGGCFVLDSQYSEPRTNCDAVVKNCTDYGKLYTGVTGLDASNDYGVGLKCANKGGTPVSGGGSGNYCYYGLGNCHLMPTDDNCRDGVLTNDCSSMTSKYCNWGKCINGSGWDCESGGCYLITGNEKIDCTDNSGTVVTTCPAGTKPPAADY